MEEKEILQALEKLAKGGKVKTKAVTYDYVGGVRTKSKEVATTKEFLPDKNALNKIMELKGLGSLEPPKEKDELDDFEV